MIANITLVIAGFAVLLAAEGVYYLVRYTGERQRAELRRRLQALERSNDTTLARERRVARSRTLARVLEPLPMVRGLERLLLQTDLSWTVASLLAYSVLLAIVMSAGFLVATRNPAVTVLGVALGLAIPTLLVFNERSKRSKKLSEQLPEALDMMMRSLQAGHGLNAGFKLVATEMSEPVAVEFARCFEEQNVGVDFRQAMENMTARVPQNLDLRIFVVSAVIQQQTGGNLVEILGQISATLRERFKFQGKVRALTAEGRASGLILAVLPFLFAFIIALLNPKYLEPLVRDPIGHVIVVGAVVLWLAGVAWINSLAKVEY